MDGAVTYFLITVTVLATLAYATGLAVTRAGVAVNYTRKINHFGHFLLPTALFWVLPYDPGPLAATLSASVGILVLLIFLRPVRARVPFIATMFASFDRPEDRPYTLVWLITQIVAASLALMPIRYYAGITGQEALVLVPILINGFGDGLAEPVGVRFGRHPYRARGFFVDRDYVRTVEGSACVLFASIATVIALRDAFTTPQFIAALLVIPPMMTVTEAKSPHTWDAPFLYFVGGGLTMLITEVL